MVSKRKIIWDNAAKQFLKEALKYIRQDAPGNATHIAKTIRLKTEELPAHPERYPLDKYRLNNTGNYRAFELYGFRISYFTGNQR